VFYNELRGGLQECRWNLHSVEWRLFGNWFHHANIWVNSSWLFCCLQQTSQIVLKRSTLVDSTVERRSCNPPWVIPPSAYVYSRLLTWWMIFGNVLYCTGNVAHCQLLRNMAFWQKASSSVNWLCDYESDRIMCLGHAWRPIRRLRWWQRQHIHVHVV